VIKFIVPVVMQISLGPSINNIAMRSSVCSLKTA